MQFCYLPISTRTTDNHKLWILFNPHFILQILTQLLWASLNGQTSDGQFKFFSNIWFHLTTTVWKTLLFAHSVPKRKKVLTEEYRNQGDLVLLHKPRAQPGSFSGPLRVSTPEAATHLVPVKAPADHPSGATPAVESHTDGHGPVKLPSSSCSRNTSIVTKGEKDTQRSH